MRNKQHLCGLQIDRLQRVPARFSEFCLRHHNLVGGEAIISPPFKLSIWLANLSSKNFRAAFWSFYWPKRIVLGYFTIVRQARSSLWWRERLQRSKQWHSVIHVYGLFKSRSPESIKAWQQLCSSDVEAVRKKLEKWWNKFSTAKRCLQLSNDFDHLDEDKFDVLDKICSSGLRRTVCVIHPNVLPNVGVKSYVGC